MARLPVLIRQTQVFELVLAGKTTAEIMAKLKVSEDTIARDMKAISEQVESLVKERSGELLATAIATIGEVIINAKGEYAADLKYERELRSGKHDYQITDVSTKALGAPSPKPKLSKRRRRKGQAEELDEELDEDGIPQLVLETTTTIKTVRPQWRSNRAPLLKIIIEATRELAELGQLKTIVIKHKGSINLTDVGAAAAEEKLAGWRSQMQTQLKSNLEPALLIAPTLPTSTE